MPTILYGADPKDKHPMKGFPQICFIQNTVSNPDSIRLKGAVIVPLSNNRGQTTTFTVGAGFRF
jgi:hypothetical protein